MELSLRTSLEAQVAGEGAVVVPGKMLVDLVRLLPDEDVEIEHRPDEGVVRVESGTYSSRLHTYNAEDFPRLPEIDTIGTFRSTRTRCSTRSVACRAPRRVTSRVPVLTGILARFEGGKLVMAATDSYRLSVKETPFDRRRTGARGDHPGARADRGHAHRRRRRLARARRPREPGRLRRRRRHSDDAPHRRSVPELPAAAARDVRAHGRAAARARRSRSFAASR